MGLLRRLGQERGLLGQVFAKAQNKISDPAKLYRLIDMVDGTDWDRPASPDPQTSKVWYYDYRTNIHHTLKQKPLTFDHLEDFAACYEPENRHVRKPTWTEDTPDGRWRAYSREELLERDKASLDVFWLKDASMTDLENLPEPEVLADEIMELLRSALASFEAVVGTQRR